MLRLLHTAAQEGLPERASCFGCNPVGLQDVADVGALVLDFRTSWGQGHAEDVHGDGLCSGTAWI